MDSLLHRPSLVLNLKSLAFHPGRGGFNPKCKASTYQDTLAHCSRILNTRYRGLILETQYQHVVAQLESPTHLEYLHFHQITQELLKTRIKKLKSLEHDLQRDAIQKKRNSNIRQHDELHADCGKLGQLI
jgi:hypothetical protein